MSEAWYVVVTEPLAGLMAEQHLQRDDFTVFNPKCSTTKVQRGSEVTIVKPYLPGYLFVQFDRDEDNWRRINRTRGVKHLLTGDPERPMPVPDVAMQLLFERCNGQLVRAEHIDAALSKMIPRKALVEINVAPFEDLQGKVTWSVKDRIKVALQLFGRAVEIPLASKDVTVLNWAGA